MKNEQALDLGGVSFGSSNFSVDDMLDQTDSVMQLIFCVDRSGSVSKFVDELNSSIEEGIAEWQKSHHAEKIMYSRIDFDSTVEVMNGFHPVKNVQHIPVIPRGTTAMRDAIKLGINNAKDYYDSIESSGGESQVMLFVFTDGADNASNTSEKEIRDMVDTINKDEANFNKFDFIMFGLCDPNHPQDAAIFEDAAKNMNIKLAARDNSKSLGQQVRSAVTVVSQSVSNGNTSNVVTI